MSGEIPPPELGPEYRSAEALAADRLREGGPVLARPNDPATRAQLNGLEGRLTRLEAHLFDPCETSDPSETEENADRDKPDVASAELHLEDPLTLVGGSVRAPGYLIGDRADRANALLGTAETVKATGSPAEIAGVRLEPCDEYGRTETTRQLEENEAARRALKEANRILHERLETARRALDLALKGAESAERDAAKIPTVGEFLAEARGESTDEEIGRGLIVCGAQRLADVGGGRHVLVECELFEHADDKPHHAAPRGPVTW